MLKPHQSFLRLALVVISAFVISCQKGTENQVEIDLQGHTDAPQDDLELEGNIIQEQASCIKPTTNQIEIVSLGFTKLDFFLSQCRAETDHSPWCDEVARPNPNSHVTFDCTYTHLQPHFFIHPEESTWNYAIEGVKIVKELEAQQIDVCTIYNWWRPEPYNKNVGGAAGRHPFGTSIDVRFCSKNDQLKAHKELCKMRKAGRIRAVGYYSSTSLHIGVGDRVANTWGKACP